LHMAQLMPLPLTVSCFSKIQIGFTFLVPAHLGSPGQRAVKRVCMIQVKETLCTESYQRFSAALSAYKRSSEFRPMMRCLTDVFGAEKRNHALLCSQYSTAILFINKWVIKYMLKQLLIYKLDAECGYLQPWN